MCSSRLISPLWLSKFDGGNDSIWDMQILLPATVTETLQLSNETEGMARSAVWPGSTFYTLEGLV